MRKLYFLFILLLAIFFRFNNLNWDINFHLHPDERFLTMVGNTMKIPSNISDYLSPQTSTMNPANLGFKFFVYGVFPISLNKILAVMFNSDNYNAFTILGRFLSALADLLVVVLVYETSQLLFRKKITNYELRITSFPLWASFFYAIAVLPIQLSHFFAVDSFLNLFMFGSFYFALRSNKVPRSTFHVPVILSAIFFGLALASKVTAIFILPLNLWFIIKSRYPKLLNDRRIILDTLVYLSLIYVVLRIADPYVFENANFFDPRPNKLYIENLNSLKSFEGKDIWYPPGIQWINKNPSFSLINLAVFGVGVPYFIFILLGIYYLIKKLRIANYGLIIILIWLLGFFVYQSFQFVKAMRYFVFIYPFLAIFAALGIKQLSFWLVQNRFWMRSDATSDLTRMTFISILIISILLIWPFAFSSIYSNKNSRVAASEWIYKNLPNNSFILSEHWDDGLPLPIEQNYGKQFNAEQLPVFDPDASDKWQRMDELLQKADYYILSSNRGWGSIPTVPEKYPRMSKFYEDLFEGRLGYKKIKEFSSYPKIKFQISNFKFQIEIPDDWADESFTVYDHPKVMIFKKVNVEK